MPSSMSYAQTDHLKAEIIGELEGRIKLLGQENTSLMIERERLIYENLQLHQMVSKLNNTIAEMQAEINRLVLREVTIWRCPT